jgi:AroM protein
VVAITIGAAPRPDLTSELRAALADAATVIESGALDGLAPDGIPAPTGRSGRPLVTRRADGVPVVVDEGWLAPRIRDLVDRAAAEGAVAAVLLCAGGFDEVTGSIPLIRPRDAAVARLRALGAHRLLVLVPIEAQIHPAEAAWSRDGFEPTVRMGDPAELAGPDLGSPRPDAVVLDFVGHAGAVVRAAADAISPTPLVDLSGEMVAAAVATMRP